MIAIVKASWIALFSQRRPGQPGGLAGVRAAQRRAQRPAAGGHRALEHVEVRARGVLPGEAAGAGLGGLTERGGGAARRRTSAATSVASSSGVSQSTPVCPSTIDSGSPPTRSAALGVPRSAASMTVRHQPSAEEAVSETQARS